MITAKDKIGYIRRQKHLDGTIEFKLIEAKIKFVRIGKTEIMSGSSNLILVGEPFITNDEMAERLKEVVDRWNKYGAETILGNRTEPPKDDTSHPFADDVLMALMGGD